MKNPVLWSPIKNFHRALFGVYKEKDIYDAINGMFSKVRPRAVEIGWVNAMKEFIRSDWVLHPIPDNEIGIVIWCKENGMGNEYFNRGFIDSVKWIENGAVFHLLKMIEYHANVPTQMIEEIRTERGTIDVFKKQTRTLGFFFK